MLCRQHSTEESCINANFGYWANRTSPYRVPDRNLLEENFLCHSVLTGLLRIIKQNSPPQIVEHVKDSFSTVAKINNVKLEFLPDFRKTFRWFVFFVCNYSFQQSALENYLNLTRLEVTGNWFTRKNKLFFNKKKVGFEVFTEVSPKTAVWWVVARCSLVELLQPTFQRCLLPPRSEWTVGHTYTKRVLILLPYRIKKVG